MTSTHLRTLVRLAVAGSFLALVGSGGAGLADTPADWETAPSESPLTYLLVLFLIPAALFVVIVVLTSLPSLVRKNTPGTEVEARRGSDLSA